MLIRRSSAASKTKMLVFVPLALVCIVCFSKSSFSQDFVKDGNTVTYRGNKIEMSGMGESDTSIMTDPVTGKETRVITRQDPKPLTVNGEKIYDIHDVTSNPVFHSKDYTFRNYIIANMAGDLKKLPDGSYSLDVFNIVVSKKGDLVYFDYRGITRFTYGVNGKEPIPEGIKKEIDKKMVQILKETQANPGEAKDKKVTVLLGGIPLPIEVRNHEVTNWP